MFSARGAGASAWVAAVLSAARAVVIKAEITVKAVFLIKIQIITNKFYLFEIIHKRKQHPPSAVGF
jgi:hypothetical protein